MTQRFFPGWCSSSVIATRYRYFEKTGEFRAPRAGEFFLSGAIPEVYPALADMDSAYYIMRPVETPPSQIVHGGFVYQRSGPAT